MNIKIRNIEEKDYQNTIEIIIDSIKGSFPKIYPEDLIDYFCNKYTYHTFKKRAKEIAMFIAIDNNQDRVVGVIGLKNNQLRTFYVKTSHQRKGIGSLLYKTLEEEAKKEGLTEIILEGSPFGIPAYKKFGFIIIEKKHKEKYGLKYWDAIMRKTII